MRFPFVSRSRYDELAGAKVRLEDSLRNCNSECYLMRKERDQALADARAAVEMVADWLAERDFGTRIFDRAPHLPTDAPASEELVAIGNRKQSARQLARQMTDQFLEQYKQRAGITT